MRPMQRIKNANLLSIILRGLFFIYLTFGANIIVPSLHGWTLGLSLWIAVFATLCGSATLAFDTRHRFFEPWILIQMFAALIYHPTSLNEAVPTETPTTETSWIEEWKDNNVLALILWLAIIWAWNSTLSAMGFDHRRLELTWLLDIFETLSAFLDRLIVKLRSENEARKAKWSSTVQRGREVPADIEKQGEVTESESGASFNDHFKLAVFGQILLFCSLFSGAAIIRHFLHGPVLFLAGLFLCVAALTPLAASTDLGTTPVWMEPGTLTVMILVMGMPAYLPNGGLLNYLLAPGIVLLMLDLWNPQMSETSREHRRLNFTPWLFEILILVLELCCAAFEACSAFLGLFIFRIEDKTGEVQGRSQVQKGGEVKGGSEERAGANNRKSGNGECPKSTALEMSTVAGVDDAKVAPLV